MLRTLSGMREAGLVSPRAHGHLKERVIAAESPICRRISFDPDVASPVTRFVRKPRRLDNHDKGETTRAWAAPSFLTKVCRQTPTQFISTCDDRTST